MKPVKFKVMQMEMNPYEIFQKEFPELSVKFNELIQTQRSIK